MNEVAERAEPYSVDFFVDFRDLGNAPSLTAEEIAMTAGGQAITNSL